jgi:hypothetical protein
MMSAFLAPVIFVMGSADDSVQHNLCPPEATAEKASEGTSAEVPVEHEETSAGVPAELRYGR